MLKKIIFPAISLLLAATMTGCSLFVPHNQTIVINGKPANATVIVNGQQMTAPATVSVKRNKDVNILVTKNGYNSYTCASRHSLSTWGTLDIIGGVCFLIPFIGLLAPGAYELNQENFYYILTPVAGK